jgi:hypothetical protein
MRRDADWDHYSNEGDFTFQVRARLREHLEYYLANFAEPGTYGEIWRTPTHDYNYRVFTTQEAFAAATAKMVMAIDYRNFKDQSKKFPRGREYHDLLLDIWADSAKLNTPGGFYGPRSEENPHGYGLASYYSRYGDDTIGRRIGDSFEGIDFGDGADDEGWFGQDLPDPDDDSLDYVSDDDRKMMSIVDELDRYGIEMEDWALNLVPSEFEAVLPALRRSYTKKEVKRMKAENRAAFGHLV